MMQKALLRGLILLVLPLGLGQCSSSGDPEPAADWTTWEEDVDFTGGAVFHLDPAGGGETR